RYVRLLAVAHRLDVDLHHRDLAVLRVGAAHLDVGAPEARQPAGERDGAGDGEVRLDRVAPGPVHFAVHGHERLGERAHDVAVLEPQLQVDLVLDRGGGGDPHRDRLLAVVEVAVGPRDHDLAGRRGPEAAGLEQSVEQPHAAADGLAAGVVHLAHHGDVLALV